MYSISSPSTWRFLFAGIAMALIVGTSSVETQADDGFVTWTEDGTSDGAGDEFVVPDESEGTGASSEGFVPLDSTGSGCPSGGCGGAMGERDSCSGASSGRYTMAAALLAATIAGILVRLRKGIRFRPLFLLGALVVLGFGLGGCPCPIKGFQEAVRLAFGGSVHWLALSWFLLLIPLTYLFGRTWCGWVCHLGALQEFLYHKGILRQPGTRIAGLLRWTRRILVGGLVVQLLVTRSNVWEEHDPFRAAFNLMIPDTALAWGLLVGLLLSSLLIYRPFCRTACPVGLVLGWVSALPGAARLHVESTCISCKICRNSCLNGAVGEDVSPIMESCIACGECATKCPKASLVWTSWGRGKVAGSSGDAP